jgi:hypothetical protein
LRDIPLAINFEGQHVEIDTRRYFSSSMQHGPKGDGGERALCL